MAGATSEAVVEEWARSEGRMVREGEHLIVPLPAEGGSPATEDTGSRGRGRPSNWEVWWALLFGP